MQFVDESERNIVDKPLNIEKAKSALNQITSESSEKCLRVQISAPSYLYTLKENEAPPFKIPEKELKPHLLIGTIVTEYEVVEIVAASESRDKTGLKNYISKYLVNKKVVSNDSLLERVFLANLVMECIDYAAQRNFSASKLACFLTIYLYTHTYFRWYYWQSPTVVWNFFKELMIRHSIQDSPDGEEVFEPEECYDILTHFHTIYLNNLPLIHILTFNVHRLKLLWPFKFK